MANLAREKTAGLTEAEIELVSDYNGKYYDAKMYMESNHYHSWRKMNDYLLGDQWKDQSFSTDVQVVINHIFRLTYTIAPILSSMLPEIYVLPHSEGQQYKEAAENLEKYIQAANRSDQKDELISEINIMRALYGNGFIQTVYDFDNQRPIDRVIAPWHVLIDPSAPSLSEARWVCMESYLSKEEIEWEYKEYHTKSLRRALDNTGYASEDSIDFDRLWSGAMETMVGDAPDSEDVKVREYFTKPTVKHPNGRQITLVGDYPIINTENTMYRRERKLIGSKHSAPCASSLRKIVFPLSHYEGYKLPRNAWGIPIVRPVMELQDLVNKVYSIVVENALKLATGKWFKEAGSGVSDKELSDVTADIITVNRGANVWRESGSPLPMYVQNILSELEYHISNVAGVHEASSGGSPGGVTAASAIEMLKQSDQRRLSDAIRSQDRAEVRSAEQKLKMIQMFGKRDEMFKFVSQKEDVGKPELEKMFISDAVLMGDFEAHAGSKAQMPLSPQDKFRYYLSLAEAGLIPPEEALKQSNIPGADRITRNMEESQREQQVIQGMIQQMLEQGVPPEEVYKRVKSVKTPGNTKMVQIPEDTNLEMTNVLHQTLERGGLGDSKLMDLDYGTAVNLSEKDVKSLSPEEVFVIGDVGNLYGIGEDI